MDSTRIREEAPDHDGSGSRLLRRYAPVVFDATHSCQLPGAAGEITGGQREFVPLLALAGLAAGADVLFLEVHDDPERAKSDAATVYPLDALEALLERCRRVADAVAVERTVAPADFS